MKARVWIVFAALLAGAADAQQTSPGFPHEKHAKLFPSCLTCHAGVASGDAASVMPAPASCIVCHNGRDAKEVQWTGASTLPTNLRFSHAQHAVDAAAKEAPTTCQTCHSEGLSAPRMNIRRADAAGCLECHKAPEHLAESASCTTCHVALPEARALSVARIAAFPKPASHARSDFASAHTPQSDAAVTQCATCHTRESCARCHANASQVRAIAALGTDARVAQLMKGKLAAYPKPSSHATDLFAVNHAPASAGCANCHTQSSCTSCHAGKSASAAVAQLPVPAKDGAPGVVLGRVRVHLAGFNTQHKSAASSGRSNCLGCHEQSECSTCHEGSGTKRYHPLDFSSRHASAAYSQSQNCATCHQTETFCRSCHQQTNGAGSAPRNGAAHAGQSLWLLQHGQAARQGLTGCTSCHQQRDCLRCHSSLGLKVNPHGGRFDASRVSARNRAMCLVCHLSDPLAKQP